MYSCNCFLVLPERRTRNDTLLCGLRLPQERPASTAASARTFEQLCGAQQWQLLRRRGSCSEQTDVVQKITSSLLGEGGACISVRLSELAFFTSDAQEGALLHRPTSFLRLRSRVFTINHLSWTTVRRATRSLCNLRRTMARLQTLCGD
jgi:hypothetical protein